MSLRNYTFLIVIGNEVRCVVIKRLLYRSIIYVFYRKGVTDPIIRVTSIIVSVQLNFLKVALRLI